MSGALSHEQTTGSLVHLHEKQTSGKIELSQGGCNTIRAEHSKASKDSEVLTAEYARLHKLLYTKENVA
jgi:hypothetical protein